MKDLKVIFMGTPVFSVPILEELIKNTNVVCVVTSPDAPVGRKRVLTPCPVKECAINSNIPVFSPYKIREDYEELRKYNADIIITCAYGQIIPKELLEMTRLGAFNIHASLLPKYRGGAPIHYAIMNGDEKAGVTLMYMDEGMDSGDMITSLETPIYDTDNLETLSNRLSEMGAKIIIDNLPSIIDGTNNREKQDSSLVTFCPIIKREDEHLDFNKSALEVWNKCRALSPYTYANFIMDDTEYKIVECEVVESLGDTSTIVMEDKKSFVIMCNDKGLKVTKIKPMGKNIMNVSDFKNGYHDTLVGKVLK